MHRLRSISHVHVHFPIQPSNHGNRSAHLLHMIKASNIHIGSVHRWKKMFRLQCITRVPPIQSTKNRKSCVKRSVRHFYRNVKSERVSQLNNQFPLKLILIFIPKCCRLSIVVIVTKAQSHAHHIIYKITFWWSEIPVDERATIQMWNVKSDTKTNKQKRALQSADGRPTKRMFAVAIDAVIVINKKRRYNINNTDGSRIYIWLGWTKWTVWWLNGRVMAVSIVDAIWWTKYKMEQFCANFTGEKMIRTIYLLNTRVPFVRRYTIFGWKGEQQRFENDAKNRRSKKKKQIKIQY